MIRFTIPGRPRPKQRPRLGYRGKKAYIYTPEETVAYEELVGFVGRTHVREPLTGPVEMRVVIYFKDRRRPDITNVVKAIEDGLNAIAYVDDRQIKRLVAEIKYVEDKREERAEVEIREREEAAG